MEIELIHTVVQLGNPLPLRLCYAWTIWKAQGQTIKSKVVASIGDREQEHGLTYTVFSRVRNSCNLAIINGFPEQRLTEKVKQHHLMEGRMREERRLERIVKSTINFLENLHDTI